MNYRPNTQKILILITDATPHVKGDGTRFSRVEPEALATRLRDEGYTVYTVTYDDPRFRRMAQETRGEFYDLQRSSDFTGIIDKIGGQIASQYRMTYVSARPAYDGTRRAIEVEVGGKKAEGAYLEKHLINVRSSPLIAAVFLLPLLMALALPPILRRKANRQPAPVPQPAPMIGPVEPKANPGISPSAAPAVSMPPPAPGGPPIGQTTCSKCGEVLRPGAKFCGRCGQTRIVQPAIPTPPPSPAYCPGCGGPLRPGTKFCGVCGQKIG
jgi:hypothetical protein